MQSFDEGLPMAALTPPADRQGIPVRLKDGGVCSVRPIGREDGPTLQACFRGLSPAARRLRFFSAKQTLTPADLAALTAVDGHDHLAFCAVRRTARGDEGEVLGVARCVRPVPESDVAELAIAVVDSAQGQGVGTALLGHLIAAARVQGIRRLRCDIFADNAGMRGLARRLGGRAQGSDEGAITYECLLPESEWGRLPSQLNDASVRSGSGQVGAHPSQAAWTRSYDRAAALSIALFERIAMAWSACLPQPSLER
jgi:RimJ/RimL family protein N-acetyltransferase